MEEKKREAKKNPGTRKQKQKKKNALLKQTLLHSQPTTLTEN